MPQKQKPIDDWQTLDDWQPVDDWQDISSPGLLQQWDEAWFNQPLSNKIKWNDTQIFDPKFAANYYDDPAKRTEDQWKIPEWIPYVGGGTYRSLGAGLLEGAGNVVGGFTTPLNLATMGTGAVANRAAKTATMLPGLTEAAYTTAPKVAAVARRATQALGAPMVVSGAARVNRGLQGGADYTGDTDWADVGFGIAEAAGGGSAAMMPKNFPNARPRLEQIADASKTPMGDLPLNAPHPGTLNTNPGGPLPTKVTLKQPTPAIVADLRNKGYVSGGVDDNGYPVMIRKDVLDKIEAPPMRPRPEPPSSSIFGENEIAFDEEITIKNPSVAAIKKLQDQGFELAEVDGNIAIFRPISEQEMRLKPGETLSNRDMFQLSQEREKSPERLAYDGTPIPSHAWPDSPDFQLMPNEFQPDMVQTNEPVLGGYSPKFEPRRGALQNIGDMEPQEMRVPGVAEGNTGIENVAMGGGTPRVLDVLGSSLYSQPRPYVVTKELLQNAFDEHRITGQTEPVKVLFDNAKINPRTGEQGRSVTIRDRGRGLTPEQIHTVFSDVGETGKAGEAGASGGFGFAKAAPFLAGKYLEVRSVVDTPEGRVRYTFEGTPAELKNQARGVPINEELVGNDVPTGLEVTTHFDKNEGGMYNAREFVENVTKRSPSITSDVLMADTYGNSPDRIRQWLDETTEPTYPTIHNERFTREPMPPLQDTLQVPGSEINIHYEEPERGYQSTSSPVYMLNKGLYQAKDSAYYGQEPVPNVPRSIVADIKATVEEGHTDYPFTANREQLNSKVSQAIDKWIEENITSGAQKKRVKELQRKYDSIQTLGPDSDMHFLDDGERLTPDEIAYFADNQTLGAINNTLLDVNDAILRVADTLGWSLTPSQRLRKFGILFQAPEPGKGTTLGIHIPRPDDLSNSAILVNLFEHINEALKHPDPMDRLATGLFTTITHEQAHIPGGGHDTSFAYRHAQLLEALGRKQTNLLLDQLGGIFDDGTGGINPEIPELLSIYNDSRIRPAGEDNAILATGVHSKRPAYRAAGEGSNAEGSNTGRNEPSTLRELYELPRGLTTTADVSFGFRQGLPLVTTANWWKAWIPAMKAMGSEAAYKGVMANIEADPIMQRRVDLATGKVKKSFGQEAGLAITDLSKKLTNREESQRSTLAERLPLGIGKVVRASNRGYNAYLNHLRFSTFKSLLDDAKNISVEAANTGSARPGFMRQKFTPEEAADLNPYRNLPLAKQIADFVNTGTGRGPLRLDLPTYDKGKGFHWKERSLEQSAEALTNILFSPRLFARNVRMLNPGTYIMADPFVRRQYVKALLSTAGAWGTVAGIASLAGADVGTDPDSSDFGKIRIGNTRLDPAGGMQQFLVAAHRMLSGRYVSSASNEEFNLGEGYKADTGKDIGERFMVNKLHPVVKFAWDLWDASEYKPVSILDRVAQMFIPLIIQDVYELAKEDPSLLPLVVPVAAGMGTQTYDVGEVEGRIVPPEYDYQYQGGGMREFADSIANYIPR